MITEALNLVYVQMLILMKIPGLDISVLESSLKEGYSFSIHL